jgi:hypothetical protein
MIRKELLVGTMVLIALVHTETLGKTLDALTGAALFLADPMGAGFQGRFCH